MIFVYSPGIRTSCHEVPTIMEDALRIRIINSDLVKFDNLVQRKPLQNLSHIVCVLTEKQPLKGLRSAIMNHFVTCSKMVHTEKLWRVIFTLTPRNCF